MQTREELDASACYILSRQQGVPFIAFLMGRTEEEVRRLIALGKDLIGNEPRRTPRTRPDASEPPPWANALMRADGGGIHREVK